MNRHFVLLFVTAFLLPTAAYAHATPVEMHPRSGARLETAPSEISIRFSERLEDGSSKIRVTNPIGDRIEQGDAQVESDGYTLTVPVSDGEGIFTVSWSVVSQDDGHFTRGAFAYSVKSDALLPATNEEVVQIASTQEAALMFVEFLGNSVLWGLLVLFVLARDAKLRRVFAMLAVCAAVCGVSGALGQLLLKTHQLASLHGIGLKEAFELYTHTVAGTSTVVRGIALGSGGMLGAWFGFKRLRTTIVVLGVPLLVFAFFRAIVSHATANPFYPTLSITVNFIHVIEKDLWLGVLVVMCVLMSSRIRESIVPQLLPRVFALLSVNLAVLTATAGYIVWLHLKDFSNITSTRWGEAFVPLVVCAICLVALHIYHVCSMRMTPRVSNKLLAFTLGAQTAAAALVVFFTSVVIITSPPSHIPLHTFSYDEKGITVELARAPYEDGMVQLRIEGEHKKPVVVIGARDGGLQPALEQRFDGGYVFPAALLPQTPTSISVVVPRTNGYDVQALFELSATDFDVPSGHGRTLDIFTVVIIGISLAGLVLSVLLVRVGRVERIHIDLRVAGSRAIVGALLSGLVLLAASSGATKVFANSFEARCIADGNMWHMMQPTKAGTAVSGETREGCMWGMGQYEYMFADAREYNYVQSLGPAAVTMQSIPQQIRAGVPTAITFSLKNADGTPATLFIDMEKYLHVVIVSEDQSAFAHIHPDDTRALKAYEIESSTFSVEHTFPKAGTYLISIDYAHGTQLESKQFSVEVAGAPEQNATVHTFASPGLFGGYVVTMDAGAPVAGEVATMKFTVSKDGTPVTTLRPYLSAVAHISVVKNDLSAFIHTHGEYHAPGTPYPPVVVRDGKIIHSMSAMMSPTTFGPAFDAHVLFPTRGRYTVWAQFNTGAAVIPASFTVDVE